MHSALKQDGKPLYEYARAGITRERAARAMVIHDMRLLDWQPPDLSFDVRCTKGTYVRVLAEDLAAQLGTIGHLAALRRLGVAPFGAEPQWSFEALESLSQPQREGVLLPVDAALAGWPRLDLAAASVSAFRQGQTVPVHLEAPGNCAYLCRGPGISRFGGDSGRGAPGSAATYFVGLISAQANPCLRASAATRTMRAFLKGLSY